MEKSNGFALLPLIIIIVIATVITGGGFYLKERIQQAKLEQSGAYNEQQRMGMKGNNGQNTNTSDWKTYQNQKYGFEVKYPANWEYTEQTGSNGAVSFGEKGKTYSYEGSTVAPILVDVQTNTKNQTSSDIAKNRNQYRGQVTLLQIGGKDAAQVDDYLGTEVFLVGNGKVYAFSMPIAGDENSYNKIQNVFKSILSSFKLTNEKAIISTTPTSAATSWKTYRNDQYGFEVKIPTNWVTDTLSDGVGVAFNPDPAPCACDALFGGVIRIQQAVNGETINDLKNKDKQITYYREFHDVAVGGQKGYVFVSGEFGLALAKIIYRGNVYIFQNELLKPEIISTFKFTK